MLLEPRYTIAGKRLEGIEIRGAFSRARSRFSTNGGVLQTERFDRLLTVYNRTRAELRKLILQCKREVWRELIDSVERDVWGLPYKIVREKLRKPPPELPEDVVAEVVRGHFPRQRPRRTEYFDVDEAPTVTLEEIEEACQRLSIGKTPGPNGILVEVVRVAAKRWPIVMRDMVNGILVDGQFPRWKRASLELIPKRGGQTGLSAFRPIYLLDTLGRVEQVIAAKLNREITEAQALLETQYGFRKGRSTLQAIDRVKSR